MSAPGYSEVMLGGLVMVAVLAAEKSGRPLGYAEAYSVVDQTFTLEGHPGEVSREAFDRAVALYLERGRLARVGNGDDEDRLVAGPRVGLGEGW